MACISSNFLCIGLKLKIALEPTKEYDPSTILIDCLIASVLARRKSALKGSAIFPVYNDDSHNSDTALSKYAFADL